MLKVVWHHTSLSYMLEIDQKEFLIITPKKKLLHQHQSRIHLNFNKGPRNRQDELHLTTINNSKRLLPRCTCIAYAIEVPRSMPWSVLVIQYLYLWLKPRGDTKCIMPCSNKAIKNSKTYANIQRLSLHSLSVYYFAYVLSASQYRTVYIPQVKCLVSSTLYQYPAALGPQASGLYCHIHLCCRKEPCLSFSKRHLQPR